MYIILFYCITVTIIIKMSYSTGNNEISVHITQEKYTTQYNTIKCHSDWFWNNFKVL